MPVPLVVAMWKTRRGSKHHLQFRHGEYLRMLAYHNRSVKVSFPLKRLIMWRIISPELSKKIKLKNYPQFNPFNGNGTELAYPVYKESPIMSSLP